MPPLGRIAGGEAVGFMGARRREVQPGQKYQQAGDLSLWEIQALRDDNQGIVHARMVRVGDRRTLKMVSVPALKDPRLYKLVE